MVSIVGKAGTDLINQETNTGDGTVVGEGVGEKETRLPAIEHLQFLTNIISYCGAQQQQYYTHWKIIN